jgi:hypothetical protein
MILRLLCIWLVFLFIVVIADARNHEPEIGRLRLKCYGTSVETRFRLSAKRTSPFESMGAPVQSNMAGELCASACRVCTALASLCSAVTWRLLVTHSIFLLLLHFSSRASPCAITFQLDSMYGQLEGTRTSLCHQSDLFWKLSTVWVCYPITFRKMGLWGRGSQTPVCWYTLTPVRTSIQCSGDGDDVTCTLTERCQISRVKFGLHILGSGCFDPRPWAYTFFLNAIYISSKCSFLKMETVASRSFTSSVCRTRYKFQSSTAISLYNYS